MRENVRNVSRGREGRERWEFALDNRQIAAVAVGALVIVGSSFVLGMNTGKGMAHQAKPASDNPLHALEAAPDQLPTPPPPKQWEFEKLAGAKPQGGSATPAPSAPAQARVPPPARPLPPRTGGDAAPATAAPGAAASSQSAPASGAPSTADATQPQAPATASATDASKTSLAAGAAAQPATGDAHGSALDRAVAAVGGAPVKSAPAPVASKPPPKTTGSKPAKAPAQAAKPAAQATARGGYVIQVAASASRVEADRIARKYASHGARVVAADVSGKRVYRVRLASTTYADRAEAERALARLSRETGARGFVTSAR